MPKLKINGQEIEVAQGTSILQAAEQLGIEIPRFCYHDRLSVPANCRMCLVEVKGGPPKPQASCALACAEGMEVETDSDMVHKARKGVMEFLLINHPLDCPICDQGGECDLQDQAMGYGYDRSRYYEDKRAVKDKDLGPLIKTVMTRCIQCTRCVRFGEEVGGTTELGLMNRGEDVEIGNFVENAVTSELSGNMIDICPVGALTSKPYAFTARPWELRKTESIDVHDAVGSNIRIDARGDEVMRILPRLHEDVNEEWISDKTRFAYDGLKRNRLDRPYVRERKNGKLKPSDWPTAIGMVAEKLKSSVNVAGIAGDLCDLESMTALKDLLGDRLHCNLDGAQVNTDSRANYIMNAGISGIEDAEVIVLIGTNPRLEAAIVNARIRKAYVDSKVQIGVIGNACDLSYPHEHLGHTGDDIAALMRSRSGFAKLLKESENSMIILGAGVLERSDGATIHALAVDLAAKTGSSFNLLQRHAARVGALDIDLKQDAPAIVKKANKGQLDLLYLMGADPVDLQRSDTFVVYQGHHGDIGASMADVVLPAATYTEKNGMYVNTEGRVQMGRMAVHPPGEAKEDWKILRAVSGEMDQALPYDDIGGLRSRITDQWPHLGMIDQLSGAELPSVPKSDKAPLKKALTSPVENFYMTNSICFASQTMQECVDRFLNVEKSSKVA